MACLNRGIRWQPCTILLTKMTSVLLLPWSVERETEWRPVLWSGDLSFVNHSIYARGWGKGPNYGGDRKVVELGRHEALHNEKKKIRITWYCSINSKNIPDNPSSSLCKGRSSMTNAISKWDAFAKFQPLAFTKVNILTLSMIELPLPRYSLLGSVELVAMTWHYCSIRQNVTKERC